MKESRCFSIMSLSSRRIKSLAILSCLLFMGTPTVWAQSSNDATENVRTVVAQERVEKTIPGTYHYQSQYEMTTDGKGNYSSTYESQKSEWFCCRNWFSSEDDASIQSGKS